MDEPLKGKKALITAASYGSLGYSCACELARLGADVAIVSSDEERVERAAGYIGRQYGVESVGILADMTNMEQLCSIPGRVKGAFNGANLDILVISTPHPPVVSRDESTDKQWEQGYNCCLRPVEVLSDYFLDEVKNLTFISSPFGIWHNPDSVIQSAYKGAVNKLAACIDKGYKDVNVNVVCPGYYDTELTRRLADEEARKKGGSASRDTVYDEWAKKSPINKVGDPVEIGSLVGKLAASDITGKAIVSNWIIGKHDAHAEHFEPYKAVPYAQSIDLSEMYSFSL